MAARRAGVIDVGGGAIGLIVSYDDRDEAKALGGYLWDGERKCWRFPASRRAECQRVANRCNEANGYKVTEDERAAEQRPRSSSGSGSGSSSSRTTPPPRWLDEALRALFRSLPPHTHRATLNGLRRALHPDTGGDNAAMQALNRVSEEIRR